MAQRGIREFDAKALLKRVWTEYFGTTYSYNNDSLLVGSDTELQSQAKTCDWTQTPGLVVKPDMLFGERGKNDLVLYKNQVPGDVTLSDATQWIKEKTSAPITLKNGSTGELRKFIVERFVPHKQEQEYYISIRSENSLHDIIAMSAKGGVDIMANWDQVTEIKIPVDADQEEIQALISSHTPTDVEDPKRYGDFAFRLYQFFKDFHFSYFELNPFILNETKVDILDTVAKLDDTAGFLMHEKWNGIEFPSGFGQDVKTEEEKLISQIDEQSGASLKLTILNPTGCVWILVAGGGASVVFADTIAETWGVEELANYGEYSGNPSTYETYVYTKTVLDLMTRQKDSKGRDKILLIGGAIANFTDVAKTFDGIIQALNEYADKLKEVGIRIYVRRGGPNYEIGLKNIRTAAKKLELPIEVYGPETHMTDIVSISLEDSALAKEAR